MSIENMHFNASHQKNIYIFFLIVFEGIPGLPEEVWGISIWVFVGGGGGTFSDSFDISYCF